VYDVYVGLLYILLGKRVWEMFMMVRPRPNGPFSTEPEESLGREVGTL
jgi:hypothetical protein